VADGVRELGSQRRLQVRQQVELASVVGAVAATAESGDTERISAAS